jgi:putative aminopeptidase FrvX
MIKLKFNFILIIVVFFNTQLVFAQANKDNSDLINQLYEFSKTSSVTGREEEAASYIQSLFPIGELKKDKLGNLILTIGSGQPRRLITAPLDEPGYVISQIQEDGYLKINPLGFGYLGNLYHQFFQGHEVQINTENRPIIGVSTVRSSHYEGLRIIPERAKPPFSWHEVFIDVGEATASEVGQKNIQLLDPVTLNKKITIISGSMISAPAMKSKAAAIALAVVGKSIAEKEIDGTLVIAWTMLELINGKGIEAVINECGPFNEIHRFNRFLESDHIDKQTLLANGKSLDNGTKYLNVKPTYSFRNPSATIDFDNQTIYEIGLPSLYPDTPVELVAISDIENLIDHWLNMLDGESKVADLPKIKSDTSKPRYSTFNAEHELVSGLVGQYGVSLNEEKVRELILTKLPNWAKPKIDSIGNIVLTFGQGDDHLVFVAHMDETGYVIDSIRDDGKLILESRGGMLPWLWEAQPALIHVGESPIQGVFEPRAAYKIASSRTLSDPLTVFAGFDTKSDALAAGIKIGSTTVTMPKEMIRLSQNRATARGFDDRVGCAALLMSLDELDPNLLKNKITFVWSTAEEIGLVGAAFSAKSLQDANTVFPIDTYVSSDDPYTDETFAYSPLGNGAVIRVLESINFISRENLKHIQRLAARNEIKVQYGLTAGGTDGQAFLGYGIPAIPLSWPGRYSHSPVEIMDYRDMKNLVLLIKTIMQEIE